ncbi:MAG TPA: TatD family hydrolase [Rectinemataceae bacterium]|nr:TatD family hydrolase [Rectinemataceae bacterium]
MVFTDSHAHLSLVAEEAGRAALDSVIHSYQEAWSTGSGPGPFIVDPGVEADDLEARRSLIGTHPFLYYAAGIWPSVEALAEPGRHLALLEGTLEKARAAGAPVSALGEGGLDYYHRNGTREAQRELFIGQLELARRYELPMIVHSRDAAADTIGIIREFGSRPPIIIHCYGYGVEEIDSFLELGCHISFAGNLTYKKAAALREACVRVPDERLLLETDSPYLNPEPRRGRAATPLDIERSYALAADLRNTTSEALASLVSVNLRALIGVASRGKATGNSSDASPDSEPTGR